MLCVSRFSNPYYYVMSFIVIMLCTVYLEISYELVGLLLAFKCFVKASKIKSVSKIWHRPKQPPGKPERAHASKPPTI